MFVLLLVDVHVHIGAFGNLQRVVQFEAVATGHSQSGNELVDVGRTVRRAHLHGLLLGGVIVAFLLQGVGNPAHVALGRPSQGNAHQHGAVAVAPAHVGGCLLVGHQAEVGSGVGVAEGGDGGGQLHHAGNGAAGSAGQHAGIVQHTVLSVLDDAHVDVQARAGLSGGNLRGEGDVVAHLIGQVADNPLGNHQLVGRVLGLHGQELNLVLLVNHAVDGEVAHLGVAVLNLSAGLCDVGHALGAELVELGVWGRFVIALLVCGGEHLLVRSDDVILQLAHGLELHARHAVEGLASLAQGVLGRAFQQFAVLVEVGAEHGQGGDFGKGVEEGGADAGQHIEVAAAGLYEGEEAAAVHSLATGEDGVQIGHVVDDEVQRLQPAVAGGIHEVDHPDVVLADKADDVCLGKFLAGLSEEGHQFVGIQFEFFHFLCSFICYCLSYIVSS